MRRFAFILFVLMTFLVPMRVMADESPHGLRVLAVPYIAPGSFIVLGYHEVRDDVRDYPDPYAVDSALLVRQFEWLQGNGYVPISLDQVLEARRGGKPLPVKAVLLTFDDAYLSFYMRVYPLLREFHFPAVLGVVGSWIDNSPGSTVYGEKGSVPAASFPTWGQLREMADSGLVELASHSYDLHKGLIANPQGNIQAAATARRYDKATGSYENDTDWEARVKADLQRSTEAIQRNTGHRPRAIVWPYGSYNDKLVSIASGLGMTIALTLDDGANAPDIPLSALRRILIEHNPSLADFIDNVRGPLYQEPVRVVQVDLDDIYSADPAQQERNLSILLDRIRTLKPSHVYLRATADTNGDGVADAAYFPNRHLPVRSDIFNRVAWQLISRGDVSVYAVMPVAGFSLAQDKVAELYEDLARHASFSGLVFDDGPQGTDGTSIEFTQELATRARNFRAPLQTVRTIYPDAPGSAPGAWAKHFEGLARAYNQVAIVIKGSRDKSATGPDAWVKNLASHDADLPIGIEFRRKAILMLQRAPASPQGDALLARQMRMLQLAGMLNFGYMRDDPLHDAPPLAQVAPVMSLRIYLDKKINAH
jgi:poly-beta-1,6-N-acetyl-D-glucosamine N-deacetylase